MTVSTKKLLRILCTILLGTGWRAWGTVWQYSIPIELGTERRAYLWVPPDCRYVRGGMEPGIQSAGLAVQEFFLTLVRHALSREIFK